MAEGGVARRGRRGGNWGLSGWVALLGFIAFMAKARARRFRVQGLECRG